MLRRVEVAARLQGRREELFAVLADVELYRHWLPGVEHSRLLVHEGDVAVAELRAPGFGPRNVTLELVATGGETLDFHQIGRFGRPDVAGRWSLRDDAERGVAVALALRVETPLLALGSRRRLRALGSAALAALEQRCGDLAAWDGTARGVTRRKILELRRRHDGLEVWSPHATWVLPRTRRGGAS